MPNPQIWDTSRCTSQQQQLIGEAISECLFDWGLLLPGLKVGNQWSQPNKTTIPVTCRDLSTFTGAVTHLPHDDHSGYHAIKVDKNGQLLDEHAESAAAGVLGLFWFDGRVEVDQSLVNNPALFKEVFLSEGAHAADFFYLWPNNLRKPLYDIYHPSGPDTHGYFEGPYFDMVGEAFMGGFVYATTNKPPTLLGFSHPTTKLVADKIKPLLKISTVVTPPTPPQEKTLTGASHAEFVAEFARRFGQFKDIKVWVDSVDGTTQIDVGFTNVPDRWTGKFSR